MRKLYILVLMLVALACTRELSNDAIVSIQQEITFTATHGDPETRTIRESDGSILWSPGDQISLFYGSGSNGGNKFTAQNTEPARIVNFSGTIGVITGGNGIPRDDTWFWATYPYREDVSCDGKSITTVLPSVQTAVAETFDVELFPSVARSRGYNLAFYNVCGGLKFTVSEEGIKSVTLRGNAGETLAGTINFGFDGNGLPKVSSVTDAASSITLEAPEGETFEVGKAYYMVLIPTEFKSGFSLLFSKGDMFAMYEHSSPATIRRSVFGTLTAPDSGLQWGDMDYVYIPDPVFREYMLGNFDTNGNGKLDFDEAKTVTNISVSTDNIYSLQGIEYCTNLTYLSCCGNGTYWDDNARMSVNAGKLTNLDVSHNTALIDLYCYYNQLNELDLSANTALSYLYCYSNQLTSLDVSQNTALRTLRCDRNQLTSLDVSQNTALRNLRCYRNQLTSLDIQQNTELTSLSCYSNQLTSLDLSQNTALTNLYCYDNQLTSLDLGNNAALSYLECGNNQLTSLDVSQNTVLTSLYCNANRLTSLNLGDNVALVYLNCDNNQLTNLDVSQNTALTSLYCYSNQLTYLDVSHNVALNQLNCESNQLTSLDLHQNATLAYLYCGSNRLTSLDVSHNTELTGLYCSRMNDASGNNLLKYLYVFPGQNIPNVTVERSTDCIPALTSIVTKEMNHEESIAVISKHLTDLYSEDSWYIESWRLFNTDRFTDDWNQRTQLYDWVAGSVNNWTSWVQTTWNNSYRAIESANALLRFAEFGSNGLSESEVANYVAEAKFFRASFYTYLVALFGDVPYFNEKGLYSTACQSGRTAKNKVMEKVYLDFDAAAEGLPLVADNGRQVARGAALAMKARAALLTGDWAVCASAAKACMDLGVYSLHPDYRELFLSKTKTSPEYVFNLPASNEYSYHSSNTRSFLPRNNGGTAVAQPSWELFFAYTCTDGLNVQDSPLYDPANPFANRDPRLSEITVPFDTEFMDYIYNPRPSASTTLQVSTGYQVSNNDNRARYKDCSYNGLILKKFVDEEWADDRYTDTPIRIIRYGDVLLMYAEAKMELGQIDQSVFDALNSIRARAYKCSVGDVSMYPAISESNQTSLRRIIRNERRCELAWENRRWFDIIRWRVCDTCLSKPIYGLPAIAQMVNNENTGYWIFPENFRPVMRDDSTIDISGIENYPNYYTINVQRTFSEDWRYLLPIPDEGVGQNPGY